MKEALEKLVDAFDDFTGSLRDLIEDLPRQGPAGAGEEPDEPAVGRVAERPRGDDIDDDTVIKMRSGDLRKVIDAYRRLTRYAREGKIPTQDERFKLHQSVRAVKHLIRKPHR